MSFDGRKVPELILIQPFSLAFFVIDFDGPAVASNAGNTRRLPNEAIADEKNGIIGKVSPTMVDNQALFAVVVKVVGVTVAVVGLLLVFVRNRNALEDGRFASVLACQMRLFEPCGEVFE